MTEAYQLFSSRFFHITAHLKLEVTPMLLESGVMLKLLDGRSSLTRVRSN